MLNNLKIGVRLSALIAVVLAFLVAISLFALQNLKTSRTDLYVTNREKLEPTAIAGRIQSMLVNTQLQSLLVMQHDPKSEFARMHDHPATVHFDAIRKSQEDLAAALKTLQAREGIGDEERRLLTEMQKAVDAYFLRV
ncbi:MAG: MCP four helix bundle domain-containing protein [Rhodocyclaceae bacterium]|nr:MCP four helix bundle domain-containing protein [Rhodocyclaceae bacterium]